MSDWQRVDLSTLAPGAVQQMTSAMGSAAGTIGQALSAVAGALDTLSMLIIDVSDPMKAVIDQITSQLEGLMQVVFNTLESGIYFYHDAGPILSGGAPDGLPGFLSRLDASLRDPGDDQKPVFVQNSQVDAVVLLAGAEDLPTLLPLLRLLGELFGIRKFLDAWDRLTSAATNYPEDIYLSLPSPPDWQSVKLRDVLPPLDELDEAMQQVLGMIRTARAFGDFLSELAQLLQEKADLLLQMADEIQAIADKLAAMVATAGLNGIHISTNQGVEGFMQELRNAGNPPPWHADGWVAGVVLLGGTADFGAVPALFGL